MAEEKYSHLKKELLKIENNENSFLGMDGGNIQSKIWFCGVEFGGSIDIMEDYYSEYIKTYCINNHSVPYRTDCSEYYLKSTFDRFLTAIYLTLFDQNQNSKSELEQNIVDNILKNELYNKNSKTFKLNLFPLAKPGIDWDKNIETQLGYSKKSYEDLYPNRIKFIKELVNEFKPESIICFSPKYYKDYFIETFIDENQVVSFSWENSEGFKILWFKTKNTNILILPFLGRGNINSYEKVISIANHIKEKYL